MSCRFLYLIGQLGSGGSERQLCYLLQAMDRERYKPAVVVWNFCEEDTYVHQLRALGVPLYSFPSIPAGAAKLRAFRRMVMHIRPEVVHSYTLYTNVAAWWATVGARIIAIGSVRSEFAQAKKEAGPWLGKLSTRWPRNQIYNNFAAADTARCSGSLFVPGQLFVIRNGLDLQRFRCVPLSVTERVRILGIGSLLPVKRWDRLLKAALELKRRGYDYVIQIAGDGPLRGSLEQKAQTLGVASCIEFTGHNDNIPGLLADASFLVHTSDTEGCPNAVMEAMACGRVVVATDVGDIPFLVEDGKSGFVVHRKDAEVLVECMVRLITNRDLCRRMGEAGRAKAEREFGLDRLVSETLSAYKAAGWEG